MNEEDFCKIVIFSLLNFMIYYLSIIFLTSTYNAKSQGNYYYSNIDDCKIHFNFSPFKKNLNCFYIYKILNPEI